MASPEGPVENELVVWLCTLMKVFTEVRDLGSIFVSRVAYRITDKRGPEPDISYVAKSRMHLRRKGYIDGAPDIAVEIVSRDSVERDYISKLNVYESAGVSEYWIIDPLKKETTFYHLADAGYEELPLTGTVFHSRVLDGFHVDTRLFWDDDRPAVFGLLQDLLT